MTIRKMENQERNSINTIIFRSFHRAILQWSLLMAIYLAIPLFPIEPFWVIVIENGIVTLFVISLTMIIANISTDILKFYSNRGNLPSLSLLNNIIRIILFTFASLSVLSLLGVPIIPILTALGVGGLAVSLALQDTLKNIFAGIQLIIEGKLLTGEYIVLGNSEEGFIQDIGWRTTQIRRIDNNIVIVPNADMVDSRIINYFQPNKEFEIAIDVGVAYDSDLEHVEHVTLEVAQAVINEIEPEIPEVAPFIRYAELADSSINFQVLLFSKEVTRRRIIKHVFIKKLIQRYRQEGIEIPYPIQSIYAIHRNDTLIAPGKIQTLAETNQMDGSEQ